MNFARLVILTALGLLTTVETKAFSLIGPFKPWMTTAIGYRLAGQAGGPMPLDEGFRWNRPTIYYAFDRSFVEYFGPEGVAAVESAIKVYGDLPAMASMSTDLNEYPLNTKMLNYSASQLGLTDVKSHVMQMLIEHLGVGPAEHFVWTLRSRVVRNNTTNYTVAKFNYDPVTLRPSSYVNGALYTYEVFDPVPLVDGSSAALAGEIKIGDLRTRAYSTVANATFNDGDPSVSLEQNPVTGRLGTSFGALSEGQFFLGLTRDDVGALRRLYSKQSLAVENLPFDSQLSGGASVVGGSPWEVITLTNTVVGTNVLGTNTTIALRPGLGKLKFARVNYDSVVGQIFNPFTVSYDETIILNFRSVTRRVTRTVNQPDILFAAADLGTTAGGGAFISSATVLDAWTQNAGLNNHNLGGGLGAADAGPPIGPGVIDGPVQFTLSSLFPVFRNFNPGFVVENPPVGAWGSFDGGSEPPVVYPRYGGLTLQVLQQIAASGGTSSGVGDSPWTFTPVLAIGTNTTTTGATTTP